MDKDVKKETIKLATKWIGYFLIIIPVLLIIISFFAIIVSLNLYVGAKHGAIWGWLAVSPFIMGTIVVSIFFMALDDVLYDKRAKEMKEVLYANRIKEIYEKETEGSNGTT